ncbi:MAG: hypothetical protein HQ557_13275 [Bacteroidetes bacterium]|nr:hypothetical protein [Bacteroidota bacterium]
MNSSEILDIIAVYATAIIFLLLSVVVIFRIIRGNIGKRREQTVAHEKPKVTTKQPDNRTHISRVPSRGLPSSDFDKEGSKQNSVINRMEKLSPLKQGILWAEILGRPGGRRRRNT